MDTGQGQGDQVSDRFVGWCMAGGLKGVDAVPGEFTHGDVVTDRSSCDGVAEQVLDNAMKLTPGLVDEWIGVEHDHEFARMRLFVMVSNSLSLDLSVGGEHRFESLGACSGAVAYLAEVGEMAGDLAEVPGGKNRLDIGIVLVEGGAADPGLFGDL